MPSMKQILILALATAVYAIPQEASQIADGQVQQISDGQVQAPTSVPPPVTQIHDGQIQAPTSAPAPVTQIHDGQIQVPTTTAVSTGIIPSATNGTFTSPAPTASFTGAAALMSWSQNIAVGAVGAAAGFAML